MSIQVKIKNVYGNDLVYPICEKAKAFAAIAGQATLTGWTISKIKDLGYTIEVVSDVKSL